MEVPIDVSYSLVSSVPDCPSLRFRTKFLNYVFMHVVNSLVKYAFIHTYT